ncbi:phage GP46 family protein [Caulobacter soli]|uniref:phage GP46 family protein n=1 Tax=Caulobacter soli TaxID=2708539 RepID=UPI0013EB6FB3|nr:phage GP46 family protein [Caulobacter soli]
MSDLALTWDVDACLGDLSLDGADLRSEEGLRTAIIISLFTDRRAQPDDVLPQDGADPRGWWGDSLADIPGDQLGSRLWLLAREKQLPSVVARARQYAQEALAWLVEDGVATSIEVLAEVSAPGVLGLQVSITRPTGPARQKFDFVWKAP